MSPRFRLGSAGFSLNAGAAGKVKVKLTAGGKRLLRKRRNVRARVTGTTGRSSAARTSSGARNGRYAETGELVSARARAVTVVLLATLAVPAPAAEGSEALAPRFAFGGVDCSLVSVNVPVPADRARALVPRRFELFQPAAATVEVVRCGLWTLDGAPLSPGYTALGGVLIQSPDGEPQWPAGARHAYFLWRHADVPAIQARFDEVGVPGELLNGISLTTTPPLTEANVPWTVSPHSLSVLASPPAPEQNSSPGHWWYEGPRGLVRMSSAHGRVVQQAGSGTLRTQAGSPLADLLGDTSATGIGVVQNRDGNLLVSFAPTPSPAEQAAARLPCLPRRLAANHGRIGPARYGHELAAVTRRYRSVRLGRGVTQVCVRGGGRFLVVTRDGRVDLVATTARGHGTGRAAPGTRLRNGRIRGARPAGTGLFVGSYGQSSRVVYGVRGSKVRFLAVASRSATEQPAALARRLSRIGLTP